MDCAKSTWISRPWRPGSTDRARRSSVDAGARRVSRSPRRHARARLARRDQPARGRLDPRRRPPPPSRLHRDRRLRTPGTRALLAHARRRHAHDVRAAHDVRSRIGARPTGVVAAAGRAGHHGARRFHERPRRGRSRRPDDDRLSRSDLFSARPREPRERRTPGRARPSLFDDFGKRLALKTLLMPGGLGSTHKVLILGKGVGTPALQGCS